MIFSNSKKLTDLAARRIAGGYKKIIFFKKTLDKSRNAWYNIVVRQGKTFLKGSEEMDGMTGKEIVNLINKLEHEGMSSDKIIEIIKYIELTKPEEQSEIIEKK